MRPSGDFIPASSPAHIVSASSNAHSMFLEVLSPTKKDVSETSDALQLASQAVCRGRWRYAYVAGLGSEEWVRRSEDSSFAGASFPSGVS